MTEPAPLLAMLGFFLIAALDALKVQGRDPDRHPRRHGDRDRCSASASSAASCRRRRRSRRPSCSSTSSARSASASSTSILVFVLVEVFDATGTLIGVAKRAGLLTEGPGHTSPQLGKALLADSTAIVAGSLLGTSTTTAYVESASGVQAGGRTGLTALTVGVLFLLGAVLLAARRLGPGLRHRAGAALRRLPDDARARSTSTGTTSPRRRRRR